MNNQLIVSISREFASGGRVIAKELAKRLNINYYDRNLLDEIAAEKLGNVELMRQFDEAPKGFFLTRTVRGMTSSPEENIAQIQFEYLLKKAESGESFVIVGRCADEVLSEYPGLVKIFVLADEDKKVERVCELRDVNVDEARGIMLRHDKKRKAYHNHYCTIKWGDSRGYDICINSSRLGIEKTADFLESYVRQRIIKMK
ncbi:MAG: cytidylate kinase-like family protein [Oscillospiraceae bacterium]|jgi:cytidylate kinase|nr:cytidylate kinase-like family protein [Oscillospiraceae bacterium]MBR1897892.1 cytidylate kinase-like family protein [Oscillospiraceae bacterium]